MRIMRFLLSFAAVFVLGFVVTAGAAPPQPKANWSPCYRETGFPFQCATVQVPLDYARPGGAAISLALVRLPAADPARRVGSLFFNPGGPGGSGFDFVLGAGPFIGSGLYTPEVRNRFDLVGFDPRGIARSTPLRCFGNLRQAFAVYAPFAFPMTAEEEAIWESGERTLVSACDQRARTIIQHMTTADVARDLDLLRQAVGDEQLSYIGYSYGSYLGVTYANLFPDKVRAVVVDGVLDPIAWSTGVPGDGPGVPFSTRLRSDMGAQATLDEFFRLCDSGAGCAFAPASATRFRQLADRLLTAPILITTPDGFTFEFRYSDLIGNALGAMYSSYSWPDFAAFLAAIESYAAPQAAGALLYKVWQDVGLVTKRGIPNYPNYVEGFSGVACSDSDNPHSYADWWDTAIAAENAYGYFGRIWTWASSVCAIWPGPAASRYVGPFTFRTANPVLVVGNSYDPATRYQGAQTVANLLPNSSLLTMHGWGHVSLGMSACADGVVSQYVLDPAAPPAVTDCNQDLVPFAAPAMALKAAPAPVARDILTSAVLPPAVRRVVR